LIDYTLIRSKRKTVALYVRDDAVVEVRAPLKMPVSEIDCFVNSKSNWITKNNINIQERLSQRKNFHLTYGSLLTLFGKQTLIIKKTNENKTADDIFRFILPPDLTPDEIRLYCLKKYKTVAKNYLIGRTLEIALIMNVKPRNIRVGSAKRNWGSCSSSGTVSYPWRLIMADNDVIDYLVVHELAHLIEPNHSSNFWAIVKKYIPDYKEKKAKLKLLQDKLSREYWD